MKEKSIKHLIPAFLAAFLAACGGGSGNSGNTPPTGDTGWQTAEPIETYNSTDMALTDVALRQIAIDANGNAIVLLVLEQDATEYSIQATRYDAASGDWAITGLTETGNIIADADEAQIAFGANGNAIAVWAQSDGSRYNIWANRYDAASGTWGTAGLIETDDAGGANSPQIAIDANGNAIAVWHQSDGSQDNIWANRYQPGLGWGTAELIEVDDAGYAFEAQIAFDANGNAIAVWRQHDGTRYNIQANRYDAASGSWGTAKLIETDDAGGARFPQIAIDASGNAIAVWQQFDGSRYNIWANRYDAASGGWGAAKLIETDDAGNANSPQIAIDANGNVIAVWHQSDGTRSNIWVNRYDAASGNWGGAELIEADDAGDARFPQIAFDASGNAIAVWQQYDGSQGSIWANRYDAASGSWGTAELIEADNTTHARPPQIAIDANGNAIAVWVQSDGSQYSLWVNHWLAP